MTAQTYNYLPANYNMRDGKQSEYTILVNIGAFVVSALVANFIPAFGFFLFCLSFVLAAFLEIRSRKQLLPRMVKHCIGQITFDNNFALDLNNRQKIHFDQVKRVQIKSNYICGERFYSKDVQHNGLNKITFVFSDNTLSAYLLLITNKNEWNALIQLLTQFYKQDIEVKEYMFNHELRSILLNPDLSYEEIQEYKKVLGITKLY